MRLLSSEFLFEGFLMFKEVEVSIQCSSQSIGSPYPTKKQHLKFEHLHNRPPIGREVPPEGNEVHWSSMHGSSWRQ